MFEITTYTKCEGEIFLSIDSGHEAWIYAKITPPPNLFQTLIIIILDKSEFVHVQP